MEMETGVVAKRYGQLESERDTFLERGREAAKLTIPTLLPEEGHSSSSIYPTPYSMKGFSSTFFFLYLLSDTASVGSGSSPSTVMLVFWSTSLESLFVSFLTKPVLYVKAPIS